MPNESRDPSDQPQGDADDAARTAVPGGPDDRELYHLLSHEEFADHAFEVLAVALVAYAHRVLYGWMTTGIIYVQCAKLGWPVWPTDAERTVSLPAVRRGRRDRQRDPRRGAGAAAQPRGER